MNSSRFLQFIWWPLYSICVLAALDPYLKADKEQLPPIWRLAGILLAIAAPLFGLYVLVQAWRKYGFGHVAIALVAIPVGSFVYGIFQLALGMVAIALLRVQLSDRPATLHRFRETPPLLSLVLIPLVVYQLFMNYR